MMRATRGGERSLHGACAYHHWLIAESSQWGRPALFQFAPATPPHYPRIPRSICLSNWRRSWLHVAGTYLGQAGFGYIGAAVAMLLGQMISMTPFCHWRIPATADAFSEPLNFTGPWTLWNSLLAI